ncbi:MAG TPA: type II secretion system minor pseudopilin GspK, partial [Bordetella sp.]|nr:type II secretion system minor pseudopilin GspK [Bordetella sp.]
MTRARAGQQGMAVVSALIVVAIVAALTSGLFLRQASAIRQVENEQARVQARWLLLGGIDWARLILRDNARQEATVRRGQLWSTPVLDTRIDGGDGAAAAVFSGGIQDEQGKYNLYNLARHGLVDDTQVEVLARLLASLGLPDALAPQLADQVALTQGRLPEEAQPPGGTAAGARAPQPRGIDDLAALLGVDAAGLQAMRRTMTLLPEPSLVNVNTAEPEVIAALVPGLSLAQARAVAGDRDRG